MLSLEQIKKYYSPNLYSMPLGILREYIQYKILETIYQSKYKDSLVFLGGTTLRIVYDNQRFSEDLDFDNLALTENQFIELTKLVQKSLHAEGFEVEIRNVFKQAFHCYIKIPHLLQKEGLSNLPDQKITIRIDTTPQNYIYKSENFLLDKFDVLTNIKVVPIELLMAQKYNALLTRKRAKGRDFFDVAFLAGKGINPDMNYLNEKLNIANKKELKTKVEKVISSISLEKLAIDVKPFLFNKDHIIRVTEFERFMK